MGRLKLISWNVNGLRALLKKDLFSPVAALNPDILCLQETKIPTPLASALDMPFKHAFFSDAEKKGYSGTAIFSNITPLSVSYDLILGEGREEVGEHPREGRVITAEFEAFNLVNVYTPNAKAGLQRLPYRHLNWEPDFRTHLRGLRQRTSKPVIVCGDLNVAHKERDLARPKENRKSAGFTDEERQSLDLLLNDGFVDSFRHLHLTKEDVYTWWSYRTAARKRNVGWRIDYFLVSQELAPTIERAHVYADIFGSDHCPVGVELELPSFPNPSFPKSKPQHSKKKEKLGKTVLKKDGSKDMRYKSSRVLDT